MPTQQKGRSHVVRDAVLVDVPVAHRADTSERALERGHGSVRKTDYGLNAEHDSLNEWAARMKGGALID